MKLENFSISCLSNFYHRSLIESLRYFFHSTSLRIFKLTPFLGAAQHCEDCQKLYLASQQLCCFVWLFSCSTDKSSNVLKGKALYNVSVFPVSPELWHLKSGYLERWNTKFCLSINITAKKLAWFSTILTIAFCLTF